MDDTLPQQPTAGAAAAASSSRLTERQDVVLDNELSDTPSILNYFPQINKKKHHMNLIKIQKKN